MSIFTMFLWATFSYFVVATISRTIGLIFILLIAPIGFIDALIRDRSIRKSINNSVKVNLDTIEMLHNNGHYSDSEYEMYKIEENNR